jgi:Na+/proline symporter
MSTIDFVVLFGTLLGIVAYGVWKTRVSSGLDQYLKGDSTVKWGTIGLSVMATQASAITFLSTPGQAYESGMAFVQNYFGLPLALIIVAAVFIPLYHRLNVYTAYEFLEKRFDFKTRLLGAFLFLVQRGLAAGITIYAPAIILSTILEWNLNLTIIIVGSLVIVYTVTGGTRAVSITQKFQMGVMMGGMVVAFFMVVQLFPPEVGLVDALTIAGSMGKLKAVDFSFDLNTRYTFWSGITGGLFLALSYFGTDQSQVQRYLTGKSVTESRLGLMFNAILKIPMQFFILLVGVMVFVFYQFEKPPVFFKQNAVESVMTSEYAEEFTALEEQYQLSFDVKQEALHDYIRLKKEESVRANGSLDKAVAIDQNIRDIRNDVKSVLVKHDASLETKDADYVFITFILNYLPHGVIGLLLAMILSAAMSSTSSELSALGSTTTIDFYKRILKQEASDRHYLIASKVLTGLWGVIAVAFALYAYLVENLIEAVNILGSLFYGTILGIFLVAFFVKYIRGNAVFVGAIISQIIVLVLFYLTEIGYLWFNLIGCLNTILLSIIIQASMGNKKTTA